MLSSRGTDETGDSLEDQGVHPQGAGEREHGVPGELGLGMTESCK